VEAAYLFGSQARGTARAKSDVDVAVIFHAALNRLERAERRLDLMAALETALGRRVDVVDLESAGCVLAHQVLRDRHLLLDRNPRRRVEVEVQKRRAYLDSAHRRRAYLQAVLSRLRRGEPLGRPSSVRAGHGCFRGAR